MTLLHSEKPSRIDARRPAPLGAAPDPEGLDELARRISAAVSSTERDDDAAVTTLVVDAVRAFSVHGPDPVVAARQVAGLCQLIGEREALAGRGPDELAEYFHRARATAQRALALAVVDLPNDQLICLREQLTAYLRELFGHALRSMEGTRRLMAMGAARRTEVLREVFFAGRHVPRVELLVELTVGPGLGTGRPVVAVDGEPLDRALLEDPAVVAGANRCEAVVPGGWCLETIESRAGGPVAVGPPVGPRAMHEAVRIARAATTVCCGRRSVDTDDVLGSLLVASSPLLSERLVRKHLDRLQDMQPVRRLGLARVLLHWLESGQPVNVVARTLGVPPQTAHSRMSTARKIFGTTLEDPDGRLELVLALRTALPGWRETAA